MKLFSFLFFVFLVTNIFAQEIDITTALKSVEEGKVTSARNMLEKLKAENSSHPNVIFLDGVLTKNAEEAIKKYTMVFEKHRKSKYADASLHRIFSYYYSLGQYKKAESYFKKMKIDYPTSPYVAAFSDIKFPKKDDIVSASKNDSTKNKIAAQPAQDKNKFTIQAGAFLSVENSTKLKDQFIKDGFTSEVINKVVGGSLLKVVTVGKFATEAEAKNSLAQIESKYNIKGRVIPISSKP